MSDSPDGASNKTIPYSDLGKTHKDVLTKGYHYGLIKFDVKKKTEKDIELDGGLECILDGKHLNAYLGGKYAHKNCDFGIKWNGNGLDNGIELHNNSITGEVTHKHGENLKIAGDITYSPDPDTVFGHLKTLYLHEHVAVNVDANFEKGAPMVLQASTVIGFENIYAGYQMAVCFKDKEITKNNFGLDFVHGDLTLHGHVDNLKEYGAGVYLKASSKLDTAVDVKWNSDDNNMVATIGGKYDLESNASVRAKFNTEDGVGVGYQHHFNDGITCTLSALIDVRNLSKDGNHKIGLAVEIEL